MVPLTGIDALQKQLEVLGFEIGSPVWFKVSWEQPIELLPSNWKTNRKGSELVPEQQVYTGVVTKTGIQFRRCKWDGCDIDGNSVWKPTGRWYQSDQLTELAAAGATVYFYPNQPDGGISNKHVATTSRIFYEIDDRPLDEQRAALQNLTDRNGLTPCAVVFTGGKSLHVYFKLTEEIEADSHWRRLARKLCILQNSDSAVTNPARAMRLSGLVRRKAIDGIMGEPKPIMLESWSDAAYTPEEFEQALDSSGLFPYGLSDYRWSEWVALRNRQRKGDPVDPVNCLLEEGFDLRVKRQRAEAAKRRESVECGNDQARTERLINDALSAIPPRSPGGGTYETYRKIGGSLKCWGGEEYAISTLEAHSPSRQCGWNVRQVIRSSKAEYSIGTLFWIAQHEFGWRLPEWAKKQDTDRTQYLGSDEDVDFLAWLEERTQADEAEAQSCVVLTQAQKLERDAARRERYRAETERIQQELNGLDIEPTIEAEGRYIPQGLLRLPERSGIILIDGTMGVGKTSTALKGLVREHRERYPDSFQGLFVPRNILGFQSGSELDIPHHSWLKGFAKANQMTLCFESIWKINPDDLPARPLVICDEASQSFKQILYGDTCRDNHVFVLDRVRQLFRRVAELGGLIVLSEDGLTNLELDFIRESSGLEVVEFLKFTKTGAGQRYYEIYDSATLTWDEIQQRIEKGENLVICSDSRRWLQETHRMLVNFGVSEEELWLIDCNSSSEPWAKEFCESPQLWINNHRPRVLLYSPSVSSGVSINDEDGWFHALAFHITHLEPRDAKQMPDRLRTNVPRFGFIKELGTIEDEQYSGCRPDVILRDLFRNQAGVQKLTQFAEYAAKQQDSESLLKVMVELEAQKDNSDSDYAFYLKHWSRYKARETYNRIALRENLQAIWQQQGHQVEFKPLGKIDHLADERKQIRGALDLEESQRFVDAEVPETMMPRDARVILNTQTSSVDDRRIARKCLLQDKLPNCPLDSVEFVCKAIIKDSGRFLKTTELLWLVQNPEAAQCLDHWNWQSAFSAAAKRNEIVWVPRLSIRSAQAKLLNECPLEPFVTGQVAQWSSQSPEAVAVKDWALLHSRQFYRYFRLSIKPDHTPTQVVNKLLKRLGFEYEAISKPGKRDEQRFTVYRITNLLDVDRDTILQSLTERFGAQYRSRNEVPTTKSQAEPTQDTPTLQGEPEPTLDPTWFSAETLADTRQLWESSATDPTARQWLLDSFPPEVLRRAIPKEVLEQARASLLQATA